MYRAVIHGVIYFIVAYPDASVAREHAALLHEHVLAGGGNAVDSRSCSSPRSLAALVSAAVRLVRPTAAVLSLAAHTAVVSVQ